ncbi:MAG: hypothetical protein KDA24_24820, partial [Deltaproteobacteria bacterium]|nr:hypothetical protein [Deltaproteobacteria bacterium]
TPAVAAAVGATRVQAPVPEEDRDTNPPGLPAAAEGVRKRKRKKGAKRRKRAAAQPPAKRGPSKLALVAVVVGVTLLVVGVVLFLSR